MKNKYINSCFNYTGGKFKLLPQILPLFPEHYTTFIDLFCGGGSVGINSKPTQKLILNDIQKELIDFFEVILETDFDTLYFSIKNIIKKYDLSETSLYGYKYYNANSNNGVGQFNKEKYNRLRNDYNQGIYASEYERILKFYLLTVYSFNNQIRFNSKDEFNLPVGKRDFNKNTYRKLKEFASVLKEKEVTLLNKDFDEVYVNNDTDFVYADPPYLISLATYNENGRWDEKNEKRLLTYLDELNQRGVRFALSNVLEHRGNKNDILIDWSNDYNIHYLNYHYNNSNYQIKNKKNSTVEVLITNY